MTHYYRPERIPPPGWAEDMIEACRTQEQCDLCTVLYSCGARISDLLALEWEQVEYVGETAFARITARKSGYRYRLLFNADATRVLKRRRDEGKKRPFPYGRQNAHKHVRQVADRAGLKPLGPHGFRHALAQTLVRGKEDLIVAKEVLGHADISSTVAYAHLTEDEIFERFLTIWE